MRTMRVPSEPDCALIRAALERHEKELRKEAKRCRELGRPGFATDFENSAEHVKDHLIPLFSDQIELLPPRVAATPGPNEAEIADEDFDDDEGAADPDFPA